MMHKRPNCITDAFCVNDAVEERRLMLPSRPCAMEAAAVASLLTLKKLFQSVMASVQRT